MGNGNGISKVFKGLLKFLGSIGGRILLTLFFIVAIFFIIYWLLSTEKEVFVIAVAVICGYFGWKTLNGLRSDVMFLFNGIGGLLFFYFIKGLISIIIGVFVTPFYLGKRLSDAVLNALN